MKCPRCSGLMVGDFASENGQRMTELRCINCGARSEKCMVDGKIYKPTGCEKWQRGKLVVSNDRNCTRI